MSRFFWISIKKLKQHEFHTTLRKLNKEENTWHRRFEILDQLEGVAIKFFIRNLGILLIAHLMLTSLRSENSLSIEVQNFVASVPVSYFLAIVSFQFLMTAISFCHLSVVMSLKASEAGKMLLSGFSTSIFGLLSGKKDDVSLGITMYSNSYFKEIFPVSIVLAFAFLTGIVAALVPTLAFGTFVFNKQIDLFQQTGLPIIEKAALACGLSLILLALIYCILFHLPLPMTKNKAQIRWNFLSRVSSSPRHPQVNKWLDE